jgi:Iap family predicted aminopeptidase
MKLLHSWYGTAMVLLAAGLFARANLATADKVMISSQDEMKEDLFEVPCENQKRLNEVVRLFGKMGAAPEQIDIEKFKDVETVVLRKPGAGEGVIVLGAHYDKAFAGCGAIDNWSGVVTLAHLYKTLRTLTARKTIVFVAFGREEEGLVGSRAMVRAIDKSQLENYCAMINLDSLGIGLPQVVDQLSSKKLAKRTGEVAKRMEISFHQGVYLDGDADSTPFLSREIPAITIHGLARDAFKIIHSTQDQTSLVKIPNPYLGYRLALSLVAEIDRCECNAFR